MNLAREVPEIKVRWKVNVLWFKMDVAITADGKIVKKANVNF